MTEPVIPDLVRPMGGQDPESSESDKLRYSFEKGRGSDYPPVHLLPTYLVNKGCVRTEDLLVQSRCSNQLGSLDQVRFFNVSVSDAGCTDE